jgi:indole-3-glycerol phosphate synthase
MGRFSQAISEGDGISVVPVLEGDVGELAALAEEAGAEAVAVQTAAEAELARAQTTLPILVRDSLRESDVETLPSRGADACTIVFREAAGDDDRLGLLYALAGDAGLDCVVEVRDEEELEETLELVDPEILIISERESSADEEDLEHTLDLLSDVPAGKLVVAESPIRSRNQVVALERAGVDAILVGSEFLRISPDFGSALAELTGR